MPKSDLVSYAPGPGFQAWVLSSVRSPFDKNPTSEGAVKKRGPPWYLRPVTSYEPGPGVENSAGRVAPPTSRSVVLENGAYAWPTSYLRQAPPV